MNNKIAAEFSLLDNIIYLNHAAVAPWPVRTSVAVQAFAEQNKQYGSKFYPDWLTKEKQLRRQLQQLLNAPSTEDIALVKNTSEALSFVAFGIDWQAGDNVVSSNQEFPSNRVVWQSLSQFGVSFKEADLMQGSSPEQALFDLVDENTRLLTISSIQFASGLRLDINKIGTFCRANNILFCIDAIQSLGAVQFDVQACQADFVMADGHKWMCGPEGLGVFYTSPESRSLLRLTQYGWHMLKDTHDYANVPWEIHPNAQRFECGSPNMLAIHALSASLSLLLEIGMDHVEQKVLQNAEYLESKIRDSNHLRLIRSESTGLGSGIVLFENQAVAVPALYKHLLDKQVICAMRGGGIRFSAHFYNSKEELYRAVLLADVAHV